MARHGASLWCYTIIMMLTTSHKSFVPVLSMDRGSATKQLLGNASVAFLLPGKGWETGGVNQFLTLSVPQFSAACTPSAL